MHISVAWWITLLCVLFSARIATAFLRHNPRLFTAMALFACSWAHVLGYYSTSAAEELSDLLSDLAAFLQVYIGSLLMLETYNAEHKGDKLKVVPLQSLALILLVFIAAPRAIEITVPHRGPLFDIGLSHTKAIISIILDLIAFVSVALGARGIARPAPFALLALILGLYGFSEISYSASRWFDVGPSGPMPPSFAYAFSALKAAYTVILGYIVALHGMSEPMRSKGRIHWILHFGYLAPGD